MAVQGEIVEQWKNMAALDLLPIPYSLHHKGPLKGIDWAKKMRSDNPRRYTLDKFRNSHDWYNIGVYCDKIVCVDFDLPKQRKPKKENSMKDEPDELNGISLMNIFIENGILNPEKHAHEKSAGGGYHWYFKAPLVEIPAGDKVLKYVASNGERIPFSVDYKYNCPVKCYPSVGYECIIGINEDTIEEELPVELESMLRDGGIIFESLGDGEYCYYGTIRINDEEIKTKYKRKEIEGELIDDYDIEKLNIILDNIAAEKWYSRDTWIKIGMALYNTFADTDREYTALHLYDKYSLKYGGSKYGGCDDAWHTFKKRDDGLALGTLIYWCLENNPDAFKNYKIKRIRATASQSDIDAISDLYDVDGNFKTRNIFTDIYKLYCDPESEPVSESDILRFLKQTIVYNETKNEYCYVTEEEIPNEPSMYFYMIESPSELSSRVHKRIIRMKDHDNDGNEIVTCCDLVNLITKYRNDIGYHNIQFYPFTIGTDPLKSLKRPVLNLFDGFKITYDPNFIVDMSKIELQLRHLHKIICRNDEDAVKYTESWIAHKIQKPHVKMGVALNVYSERQGVGKNMFFDMIAERMFGSRYAPILHNIDYITGDFNDVLEQCVLAICDEMVDASRARLQNDRLKAIITSCKLFINRKFKKGEMVVNFTDFIMLTNNKQIPGRRMFMLHCDESYMNPEYYTKLYELCTDNEAIKHLFHYFAQKNISDFNPKQPPMTQYNMHLILHDLPEPIKFLIEAINNPNTLINVIYQDNFNVGAVDLYNCYKSWASDNGASAVKKDTFYSINYNILGIIKKVSIAGGVRKEGFNIPIVDVKNAIINKINQNPKIKGAYNPFQVSEEVSINSKIKQLIDAKKEIEHKIEELEREKEKIHGQSDNEISPDL